MLRNVSSAYAKIQEIAGYHRLPDDESIRAVPKTLESCQALALQAARLSQGSEKNKATAVETWKDLGMVLKQLNLDRTKVIDIDLAPDLSIIEAVMRAGDWPSCRVIHGLLPSGHYAHGRIKRDDTTLVFIPQGDNQPDFGWKAIGGTAYYVGELVDGKMEGSGRKVELGPQFFEGSFSNNALHGRCTYHDSRHPEYDFIGHYHDGKLIHKEPKHENSPITSLRAAFRLPTIGLKIKNE